MGASIYLNFHFASAKCTNKFAHSEGRFRIIFSGRCRFCVRNAEARGANYRRRSK